MYTDEGELEFDEDEMAALEEQRSVAKLFPDYGSEPDFVGFHASEPAGNLSGGNDSRSEAIRLVMRRQLQHTGRTIICQIRVSSQGPLIHASGSSA